MIPNLVKRYLFYQRSQRWSLDRLQAYRDEQLRRIIRHAAEHVPYYCDLFKNIGLDPERFRGREDMHRIPLLDKETVRTRQQELIADNARHFGMAWESTSGSTGTPLRIIVDQGARSNKLAALLRSYHWADYRFGKRTFSLQSYYLEDDFKYKRLFRTLRFDSNRLKRESALRVLRLLERFKPQFIMGFPFDLLMLSQFAAEAGLELPAPDSMVTYGETLSPHKRQSLETAYRCRVFNYYSQHECVSMIAECEQHSLHLADDFAYHEVANEQEGGRGELVGTGLYNYAMPLIRYRTRDDLVIDPAKNLCPCGRSFPIIKEIIGKQCDYIETPDGRLLGAVMSHSMDHARGVKISQCVQDARDHVYVNLVVDNSYNDESQQALERDLRKRLGQEMTIDIRIVPQLEKRPGGKTPFILSKIGHHYA